MEIPWNIIDFDTFCTGEEHCWKWCPLNFLYTVVFCTLEIESLTIEPTRTFFSSPRIVPAIFWWLQAQIVSSCHMSHIYISIYDIHMYIYICTTVSYSRTSSLFAYWIAPSLHAWMLFETFFFWTFWNLRWSFMGDSVGSRWLIWAEMCQQKCSEQWGFRVLT